MNTDKSEKNHLTIWGAIGPNGQLVKSSIGTFKSEAKRWALKRGNYEVVKLGTVPAPQGGVSEEEETEVEEKKTAMAPRRGRPPKAAKAQEFKGETPPPRRRGRPRKEHTTPKYLEVDQNFFGRGKK